MDPNCPLQFLGPADGLTLSLTWDGVTFTQNDECRGGDGKRDENGGNGDGGHGDGGHGDGGHGDGDGHGDGGHGDGDGDGGGGPQHFPVVELRFGQVIGVDWQVLRHDYAFTLTPLFFLWGRTTIASAVLPLSM